VKAIKITIRGILINASSEAKIEIDKPMIVFSSAKRYAFKRLLENKNKKQETRNKSFIKIM